MLIDDFYAIKETMKPFLEKKIVIWGAANRGRELFLWIKRFGYEKNIEFYIDKDPDKWNQSFMGVTIYSSEIIKNLDENSYIILIASAFENEIVEQIKLEKSKIKFLRSFQYSNPSRIASRCKQYINKRRFILIKSEIEYKIAVDYLALYGILISESQNIDQIKNLDKNNKEDLYIIINQQHIMIEQKLMNKGYKVNVNYIVLTEFFHRGYYYLKDNNQPIIPDRGTIGNKNLTDYFCPLPFTQLFYYQKTANICSPTWNDGRGVGDPREMSIDELWNSSMAQMIRASVLSGSYYFCNEEMCWRMLEGKLLKKSEITDPKLIDIIQNNKMIMDEGPEFLNLGFSRACNLKCKMCRPFLCDRKTYEKGYNKKVISQIKEYSFHHLKRLIIPGDGELFYNSEYLDILHHIDDYHFPALEAIWIYSNGLLFTKKEWDKIEYLSERYKIKVFISTDAANSETYRRIRGGNFHKLKENIRMLAEQKNTGKIAKLYLPFCIQKDNFREMIEFIYFAKDLGADSVHFERLFYNSIDECVHRKENIYYETFVDLLRKAVAVGKELNIEVEVKPFTKILEEGV